jgi:hypothetical protein
MKITVSKTLDQVAREFALAGAAFRNKEPKLLDHGRFVAFRPDPWTEFGMRLYKEWDRSAFPFGKDNWRRLWRHFGRWIGTDPRSVHRGAELPSDGMAVLMAEDHGEEFAIVCQQWVEDPGWWSWVWRPVAVIART